jgi:hypothetical protein
MSTYKIRDKFSFVLATSSIDYIRNYNFNTATVSDITLAMANSDEQIPITVNMTTTVPWIQIVDITTGNSLKYPQGNVVLQPTSSTTVLVKIDLPPEIENIPESTIYPNISLDIKSGSFPIIPPASGDTNTGIVVNEDIIFLNVNESTELEFTIYDENGNPDLSIGFDEIQLLDIDNLVASAGYEQFVTSYSPITIRGTGAGETVLNISARGFSTPVTIRVLGPSSSGPGPNSGPPGPPGPGPRDEDRETTFG